jgi:Ca2+-binding EF-hand superfamily protein
MMTEFSISAQKKGFNLEMLFRAADRQGRHKVKVSDFKGFLGEIGLDFSKGKISRVIYILDEGCTGEILLMDFLDTLEAYEVGGEPRMDSPNGAEEADCKIFLGFVDFSEWVLAWILA